MISSTPVSAIMTKDVVVLDVDDSLTEAERVFGNHNLRHAPVLHGGQLVGMLSLIDLRRSLQAGDEKLNRRSGKVGVLMTPDPVSIQVSATVHQVATLLTEDEFHAIPVLEGDRVVGIVSTTDVIRFLIESVESLEAED